MYYSKQTLFNYINIPTNCLLFVGLTTLDSKVKINFISHYIYERIKSRVHVQYLNRHKKPTFDVIFELSNIKEVCY